MTRARLSYLTLLAVLLSLFMITCNSDGGPVTPYPPYDPTRPLIEDFTSARGSDTITDNVVFSGEDVTFTVNAVSQAFPVSCGLTEDEVVEDNLIYSFSVTPPAEVPAPGLLTQTTPQSPVAMWRVPNLDQYDNGEGVLYLVQVNVYDECLENEKFTSLTMRAFANQGPPVVNSVTVQSSIDQPTPVTELIDQNGYYEVEPGDTCRIDITATKRTSDEICENRSVPVGEELRYQWGSSYLPINLSFEQDPTLATWSEFDVPTGFTIGDTFQVTCRILDDCTDMITEKVYRFIVVDDPRITDVDGTLNGDPLQLNIYYDGYEVLPGDEVILWADAFSLDPGLCDLKGITPDLRYVWTEQNNSSPVITIDYDQTPVPNDRSEIEFVVPAASNGTEYLYDITVTDQCNGLTDSETANFIVIVPPDPELTYVMVGTTEIEINPESGRYEVITGGLVTVRITGNTFSGISFCQDRGVSQSPPGQYYWVNPYPSNLVLNYEQFPDVGYSDLVFVVPDLPGQVDVNMRVRVKDLCNELVTELTVPFRVN